MGSRCNFLDLTLTVKDNIIETDLFRKPTNSSSLLHFYSYHPRHIKRNIPYNQAIRIQRLVSNKTIRDFRQDEMKKNFI